MLKKKGKTKVLTIQSSAKGGCGCTHQCRCTSIDVNRTSEYRISYEVSTNRSFEGIEWS